VPEDMPTPTPHPTGPPAPVARAMTKCKRPTDDSVT
jgi:hypothetical protein